MSVDTFFSILPASTLAPSWRVALTLPGRLRNLLFERDFPAHELVTVAAFTLRGHIRDTADLEGHDWTNGMIGAAHACGNSLNYNPHVHIVATRELVNLRTGEIIDPQYIPYVNVRVKWMKAVLKMLVRKNYIAQEEAVGFLHQYPGGFHVHFKQIRGNEDDVLFKTAEYLGRSLFEHHVRLRH